MVAYFWHQLDCSDHTINFSLSAWGIRNHMAQVQCTNVSSNIGSGFIMAYMPTASYSLVTACFCSLIPLQINLPHLKEAHTGSR